MAKQLISLPPQFRKPHSHSFLHPPAVWNHDQFLPGTMRKSSNSPLAAISLPSISHRRSGTAHRKSVQHERHELPWPDPIDQNADAHRHENDQGNIVHMQLKAQEMNRQDVNQINGEAGAGYDVDRPPKQDRK